MVWIWYNVYVFIGVIMKDQTKQTKNQEKKQKFGDVVENHELVKRTLMVAAFPAMVKEEVKDGHKVYSGFLPGFDFCEVDNIEEIGECMQVLQDMLDDEVESLIVFGKQLPDLGEDDELMEQYPGYDIRMLDINVYALPDEDLCTGDCSCCSHGCAEMPEQMHPHHCDCGCEDEEEYDECEDDDCDCHHHHHVCEDEHCDCQDSEDTDQDEE